jgi:periplasmic copper chaperone A
MHAGQAATTAHRRGTTVRRCLLLAGATIVIGASASPAAAHVEPTVTIVPAASEATVEFVVQHGCDASPTTQLEFQVPELVTDATPLPKAGWASTVDRQVIAFTGGPLPPDEEGTFSVRFSVPDAPGTTLVFPFLQTCEEGSIDWIQLDPDGERPAPVVAIGPRDPNAPATTAPPPTVPGTGEPAPDPVGSGTSITLEASTTVPAGSTVEAEPTDDPDAPSNAGLIGAIGVLLVTVVGVGVVIALRRRER